MNKIYFIEKKWNYYSEIYLAGISSTLDLAQEKIINRLIGEDYTVMSGNSYENRFGQLVNFWRYDTNNYSYIIHEYEMDSFFA